MKWFVSVNVYFTIWTSLQIRWFKLYFILKTVSKLADDLHIIWRFIFVSIQEITTVAPLCRSSSEAG